MERFDIFIAVILASTHIVAVQAASFPSIAPRVSAVTYRTTDDSICEQAIVPRLVGVHKIFQLDNLKIRPTDSQLLDGERGYSYMVLGSGGRQAVAAVYDLVVHGTARRVTMVETSEQNGTAALEQLKKLLGLEPSKKLHLQIVDSQVTSFKTLIEESKAAWGLDVVLSCLPYFLNPTAAAAAIAARVHYADLGGHMHTTKVIQETLGTAAQKAGVMLITDLGLAPGLCNILAVAGLNQFELFEDILIYCGGLPQDSKKGPLGYQWIFSPDGVVGNYVDPPSTIVSNGKLMEVEPFSLRERILFDGIEEFEAATTEGATATLPDTLKGRIRTIIYRTLRYKGHWDQVDALWKMGWFDKETTYPFETSHITPWEMTQKLIHRNNHTIETFARDQTVLLKLLASLGLISRRPIVFTTTHITPRALFVKAAGRPFMFHLDPDLVALRVVVRGFKAGTFGEMVYEMLDRYDPTTGFMSMARTTGFTAAMIVHRMAQGKMNGMSGHVSMEAAVENQTESVLDALSIRGIRVTAKHRILQAA